MANEKESLTRSRSGPASEFRDPTVDWVVGELLRNSFNAVKAAQHKGLIARGKIDIDRNYKRNSIAILDNGIGMTPDAVRDAFFTRDGSDLSDLPFPLRSGGHGYGKNAIVFGTEEIMLVTVRDGVKTELSATADRARRGEIEIHRERTRTPNGTLIDVKLPESSPHSRSLYVPADPYFITPLSALFTGKDVDIAYNGKSVDSRPQSAKLYTLSFDWGQVDLYAARSEEAEPRQHVLCGGMFQFVEPFGRGSERNYEVALDVRPSVSTDHPHYPFPPHYLGWNAAVRDDVRSLQRYVRHAIFDIRDRRETGKFSHLVVMPRLDPRFPQAVDVASTPPVKLAPLHRDPAAEDLPGAPLATDLSELPPRQPLFRSTLDVVLPVRLDAALRRAGAQPAAAQMFSELGSAVLTYTETVSRLPGYEGLAKYRGGISLDKGEAGINIAIPFKGIFINPYYEPLYGGLQSTRGVAGALLGVLNHEAVHEKVRDHNADFAFELVQLEAALHENGDYDRLKDTLHTVVSRHWKAYQLGSQIYEHAGTRIRGPELAEAQRDMGGNRRDDVDKIAHGDRDLKEPRSRFGLSQAVGGSARDAGEAGTRAHVETDSGRAPAAEAVDPVAIRQYSRRRYQGIKEAEALTRAAPEASRDVSLER